MSEEWVVIRKPHHTFAYPTTLQACPYCGGSRPIRAQPDVCTTLLAGGSNDPMDDPNHFTEECYCAACGKKWAREWVPCTRKVWLVEPGTRKVLSGEWRGTPLPTGNRDHRWLFVNQPQISMGAQVPQPQCPICEALTDLQGEMTHSKGPTFTVKETIGEGSYSPSALRLLGGMTISHNAVRQVPNTISSFEVERDPWELLLKYKAVLEWYAFKANEPCPMGSDWGTFWDDDRGAKAREVLKP